MTVVSLSELCILQSHNLPTHEFLSLTINHQSILDFWVTVNHAEATGEPLYILETHIIASVLPRRYIPQQGF